jgi:hypothetical protein
MKETKATGTRSGQLLIPGNSRRRFNFDTRLLPNRYLANLQPEVDEEWLQGLADLEALEDLSSESETEAEQLRKKRRLIRRKLFGATTQSIGYPAWNLLYYALFCSLKIELEDIVVVETGTHQGLSTIVMAQALHDLDLDRVVVHTVDQDEGLVEAAKANVEAAGLSAYVRFHVDDALAFLSRFCEETDHIDFAFIDDLHTYQHVVDEISIVCPKVAVRTGMIYFDNTSSGGVAPALRFLRRKFGGNLIEFDNCSMFPPGNAIWQPDERV